MSRKYPFDMTCANMRAHQFSRDNAWKNQYLGSSEGYRMQSDAWMKRAHERHGSSLTSAEMAEAVGGVAAGEAGEAARSSGVLGAVRDTVLEVFQEKPELALAGVLAFGAGVGFFCGYLRGKFKMLKASRSA